MLDATTNIPLNVEEDQKSVEAQEKAYWAHVDKLLDESLEYSKRPDAKWYTHEEVWAMLRAEFPDVF